MSEKNGPFDNVVEVLRHSAFSITDAEAEAAIRVLIVAGRVEKKEALASLDDIYLSASVSPWDRSVKHLGIVRSLLESLPDKEEK